jgi:hypothetical protein
LSNKLFQYLKATLAEDYVCLKPMDGYRDMPVEEMVRIQDKDDLSNCPIPRGIDVRLGKMLVKNTACIRPETHYFKGKPTTGEIVSIAVYRE